MSDCQALKKQISQLRSDFSQLAGRLSAMEKYMDLAGIPKIGPSHKRVKLLVTLYKEAILKNEELAILNEALSRSEGDEAGK